jgi:ribosomal protein S18 acetylase RimI-like enzyme
VDYSIRPYHTEDFLAVKVLEEEHGHDAYSAGVFIRQAAELYPSTFLVLEDAEGVIGYTIGASVQDTTSQAWCLRLAVRKDRRQDGWGKRLFTALLILLSSRGVHTCFLSVSPNNIPAYRLYLGQGFRIVRKEKDYFGKGETRYLMKKDL